VTRLTQQQSSSHVEKGVGGARGTACAYWQLLWRSSCAALNLNSGILPNRIALFAVLEIVFPHFQRGPTWHVHQSDNPGELEIDQSNRFVETSQDRLVHSLPPSRRTQEGPLVFSTRTRNG
jgi:hypothetical protein